MVNKIVLVGYMGSGKTTVAKKIAKELKIPHIDLDNYIEKKHDLSIEEVFKTKGEIWFRSVEKECFEEVIATENSFVLSLGGGTPCYYDNYKLLQLKDVFSVYLKTPIDTIAERLKFEKATRPLIAKLSDDELLEFIGKHLFERNFYYLKSKQIIEADGKSVDEIVKEITGF